MSQLRANLTAARTQIKSLNSQNNLVEIKKIQNRIQIMTKRVTYYITITKTINIQITKSYQTVRVQRMIIRSSRSLHKKMRSMANPQIPVGKLLNKIQPNPKTKAMNHYVRIFSKRVNIVRRRIIMMRRIIVIMRVRYIMYQKIITRYSKLTTVSARNKVKRAKLGLIKQKSSIMKTKANLKIKTIALKKNKKKLDISRSPKKMVRVYKKMTKRLNRRYKISKMRVVSWSRSITTFTVIIQRITQILTSGGMSEKKRLS